MWGDAEIGGVAIDSRRVTPGALFVCMPGMTRDSQSFLPAAAENGATAAMVYDEAGREAAIALGLAAVQVDDYDDTVWRICDAFFDHPTRQMKVVGVTGTNGKTTTAWLLRDILAHLGMKAGYLGTLGFKLPDETRELPNTTPFAVDLYNLLAEARDKGIEALAMEVSSHALAQKRVDGVEFDAAVFTNLTQDHLDYHGTMAEYEAAKWRLFTELPAQSSKAFRAAFNIDDAVGLRWSERFDGPLSYGIDNPSAILLGKPAEVGVDRIRLTVREGDTRKEFVTSLGGSYNVYNLMSAVAGARCLDIPLGYISLAASGLHAVPGRFEPVLNDQGIGILVDYAHTPDAVEKLLEAVRPLTDGRVITVFGCGGDRDRAKRPLMARAASERSDLTVVTSDNPRTEDPAAILQEVVSGIAPGRSYVAIQDRGEAVAHAVLAAHPGDVVVIAGKGHENYQIIGREKIHMDDRELARAALGERL
ncbi:UDP-N-acetylmuramoylalanyl-D-glutamyl-2 [Fimbriimonas ginsengisoli Gsoil 348]|uniref:UDP-N-acetylmuramoyl-L-alanyl-D-glutamate--2,6-diaminopimelate ligase n=1 Tax=Fimbriimonas ginsengisoli Gsoil 348 TaxID=661478 RepID=A0A068NZ90_FIMGI|nr:UDP-N-acetylmuramoylalanyl-D-glutamyl-2 [Fimbriimonas ginsengisoli Gsoil 348]